MCDRGQHLVVGRTERIVDRVIGWITLAVVTTVTVLMVTLVQMTSCADAAPGGGTSSCTTTPMLGVAGSWIAGLVGAGVVACCIWQVVRTRRSEGQTQG
ncbi:hypothetical protein BIU98_03375 [Curtobacterium sp. MMLR14_010]|nr:hypothetical protein BIU98_03375 [Curtobacterium sp. MMLR14_010]